jgi:hypothetical protein
MTLSILNEHLRVVDEAAPGTPEGAETHLEDGVIITFFKSALDVFSKNSSAESSQTATQEVEQK